MRGAVFGVAALILVQSWLYGGLRDTSLMAVERFENGDPAAARPVMTGPVRSLGRLTIQLTNLPVAPGVQVLVNGTPVSDFANGRVSLAVRPGDVVEIDGSRHRGQLTFRVVASEGDASRLLGQEITVRGTIVALSEGP